MRALRFAEAENMTISCEMLSEDTQASLRRFWELSRENFAIVAREPRPAMFVHPDDSAIQSAFTSPTLRIHLRRGGTVHTPYGADVIFVKRRYEMNRTKVLGLAVIAAVLAVASPVQRAGAVSLINPGAAIAVQDEARQVTTEVRWGHHGWHHHHGWHRGWYHRRHWGWHHHHWHHRHW
jgi:hypothetical protein